MIIIVDWSPIHLETEGSYSTSRGSPHSLSLLVAWLYQTSTYTKMNDSKILQPSVLLHLAWYRYIEKSWEWCTNTSLTLLWCYGLLVQQKPAGIRLTHVLGGPISMNQSHLQCPEQQLGMVADLLPTPRQNINSCYALCSTETGGGVSPLMSAQVRETIFPRHVCVLFLGCTEKWLPGSMLHCVYVEFQLVLQKMRIQMIILHPIFYLPKT